MQGADTITPLHSVWNYQTNQMLEWPISATDSHFFPSPFSLHTWHKQDQTNTKRKSSLYTTVSKLHSHAFAQILHLCWNDTFKRSCVRDEVPPQSVGCAWDFKEGLHQNFPESDRMMRPTVTARRCSSPGIAGYFAEWRTRSCLCLLVQLEHHHASSAWPLRLEIICATEIIWPNSKHIASV